MTSTPSASSDLNTPFIFPRPRPPPPASFHWTPAPLPLDYTNLPPLPAILDPGLALQARTSKEYLVLTKGTSDCDTYDHEVASYRTLEWLGDGKLHQAYSEGLSRLLPSCSPGVLSILRDQIESNAGQSYIGWFYELDRNILEPARPSKPRALWRPLSQTQKIVSDLFEAHIGGLVKDARQSEVDRWIDEFLNMNSVEIRNRACRMEQEQRQKIRETRSEGKKRCREEFVFEEGREIGSHILVLFLPPTEAQIIPFTIVDPVYKFRRTSLLPQCPMETLPSDEVPRWRWHDRTEADGKYHSHFISGNTTIGCGRGQKQATAQRAAVVNCLDSLASNEQIRDHLCGPPPILQLPDSSARVRVPQPIVTTTPTAGFVSLAPPTTNDLIQLHLERREQAVLELVRAGREGQPLAPWSTVFSTPQYTTRSSVSSLSMTVPCLPVEIFHRIVDYAISPPFRYGQYLERQRTLSSLCLVSKQSGEIARVLLFATIWIRLSSTLEKIIATVNGMRRSPTVKTAMFDITYGDSLTADQWRRFAGICQDLRSLFLHFSTGESQSLSTLRLFPRLQDLRIRGSEYVRGESTTLPQLESLALAPEAIEAVSALFSPIVLPSLRNLAFVDLDTEEEFNQLTLSHLNDIVPRLRTLYIEVNIIPLAPPYLVAAFDRTLFQYSIYSDYPHEFPIWLQSIFHLRILELCSTTQAEDLEPFSSLTHAIRSRTSIPLQSIYLDPSLRNLSRSSSIFDPISDLLQLCLQGNINICERSAPMSTSTLPTVKPYGGGHAKTRNVEPMKEGKWIELQKIDWTDEDGKDRVWEMAARKTTSEGGIDAVAIAALLKHPNRPISIPIILQYRPPIQSICVELPAGLIDKGESPETSALRELYEETGYGGDAFERRVKVVELGGTVVSDPGMSKANMVLATLEVELTEGEEEPKANLDEGEHIEVRVTPLKDLYRHLQAYEKLGYVVDTYAHHFAAGIEVAKRIGIEF
ncbi:hypothetical protein JCM5353_007935 [Sporobolomyces roseus]